MNTDILSRAYDSYFTWSGNLAAVYYSGLLRTWLTFVLPAALMAMAFSRGNRSHFGQVLCCTFGLLLAATLPLERFEARNRFVRGWTIAIVIVGLVYAPSILAFLLVSDAGPQRKVRFILYLLLAGLMLGIVAQKGSAP